MHNFSFKSRNSEEDILTFAPKNKNFDFPVITENTNMETEENLIQNHEDSREYKLNTGRSEDPAAEDGILTIINKG